MTTLKRMDVNPGPYELTVSGLQLSGESTPEQWEQCGQALKQVDEARQWAIGDWLADGKRHYGDGLYKRAAEILGASPSSLAQYKSMADRFELCRRLQVLSYAHHVEVASVKQIATDSAGKLCLSGEPDTEKIGELLTNAERQRQSVVELREAVRSHKEWQRQHIAAANEPEKYAVIYADPPWQYSSGDQHSTEEQDTVLGDHYPSMSLGEICQLPQANLAATDCVLFLWCTSPTLEEAFQVINAWGFNYKASMVWDKVAHNVGHYVSVRHELLLIATKGQPPKVPKLVDSVYMEERTEHSRKPEYFRDLIDELYPSGTRLEMFARGELPEHWQGWGNECNSQVLT